MPIRRLRSLDEAEQSAWLSKDDIRLWPTVKAVWEFSDRVHLSHFPPGVHKHRTIDDANRQAEEWERLNLRKGKPGADADESRSKLPLAPVPAKS